MRHSVIALAGLAVIVGYVRRHSGAEPVAVVASAAAAVRPTGVVATGETHTARVAAARQPQLAAAPELPPLFDSIPALPEAPPRAIHGRLFDLDGEPAVGATVVATSPNLAGEQVVINDENGYFLLVDLPAGDYTLTVYYNNMAWSQSSVAVADDEGATVDKVLDPGELPPREPVVDLNDSVKHVDGEIWTNIPTGRTFGAVLGVVTGSQVDSAGVPISDLYITSLSGATSDETVYIVDE